MRFNVYPSQKDDRAFYDRAIDFSLILEDGTWVVDDVITRGHSARKEMADEIASFSKK